MRGAAGEHKSMITMANGRSAGLDEYAPRSIPICLFVIYRDIHYAVAKSESINSAIRVGSHASVNRNWIPE